jgi:hypothetical protein
MGGNALPGWVEEGVRATPWPWPQGHGAGSLRGTAVGRSPGARGPGALCGHRGCRRRGGVGVWAGCRGQPTPGAGGRLGRSGPPVRAGFRLGAGAVRAGSGTAPSGSGAARGAEAGASWSLARRVVCAPTRVGHREAPTRGRRYERARTEAVASRFPPRWSGCCASDRQQRPKTLGRGVSSAKPCEPL